MFDDVSQCFKGVSQCFTMFNNVSLCLVSRATIGITSLVTEHDNAAGIDNNTAGIGDNSAEISDDTVGIVDIVAKVIPY